MLLCHLPQLSLHLLLICLYQYIQQYLGSLLRCVWIMYDIIQFSLFFRIYFFEKNFHSETHLPLITFVHSMKIDLKISSEMSPIAQSI